ncbi:restriction endonuclease subunit S [Mesomycoplasma dispar]|uniref:Type I restriction modification DNA specificity domain-containing protein n=1 Tax=Mesomycoplasma dispar TaxID=86660 RepID=A0ABM6PRH6_9BACT|nr:restriction endonuclease subunit S [Mesomycoplasma dispar]ATP59830.1 hypothetical protein CSW10_02745 [Mesomycoplasma dispar]
MIKIKEIFELIGKSEIKYFKIGDLFEIKRGNPKFTKEFINKNPGNFPVYSGSTINNGEIGKISTYDFEGEFLTWTIDGYAGAVFYRNEKFSANSHCGIIEIKDQKIVNPKFLQYILQTLTPKFVNFDAIIPSLSMEKMKNIQIPVPPIEIQEKILNIFEKIENFDALIDILDSEKELRLKQLNFYKNKILSFLDLKPTSHTHTHTQREREREREQKGLQILYKNIQRTTFDLH